MSLEAELHSMMNANDGIAGYRLTRGGVSLAACWYVRPVVDAGEDSDQRLYFDHEPAADEYDSSAYGQPARWRPNLQSGYVAELGENMQAWIDFRSLYPWTSVNTDSYQSGEASAVDALEDLVEELSEKETLASAQDEEIAALMLRTFDFFPPTINQSSRTVYHAAAVAARHVVENFYFYPGIKPRWREDLAAAFLTAWKARVDEIVNPPAKRRKTAGGSSTRVARKTDGLSMLLDTWDALTVAYNEYYRTFSRSLP